MLDDFFRELLKPSWWMGVVAVSFLINLASAYAKPVIDEQLGRFWLSSKQAAARRQALIEEGANKLLRSPQLVIDIKLDILLNTLQAIFSLALAIVCFILISLSQNERLLPILTYPFEPRSAAAPINLFLLFLGAYLLVSALVEFRKSIDKERILRTYRKLQH